MGVKSALRTRHECDLAKHAVGSLNRLLTSYADYLKRLHFERERCHCAGVTTAPFSQKTQKVSHGRKSNRSCSRYREAAKNFICFVGYMVWSSSDVLRCSSRAETQLHTGRLSLAGAANSNTRRGVHMVSTRQVRSAGSVWLAALLERR